MSGQVGADRNDITVLCDDAFGKMHASRTQGIKPAGIPCHQLPDLTPDRSGFRQGGIQAHRSIQILLPLGMLTELRKIAPDRPVMNLILHCGIFQFFTHRAHCTRREQRCLNGNPAFVTIAITHEHHVIGIGSLARQIAHYQAQAIPLKYMHIREGKILARQFSCIELSRFIEQTQHRELICQPELFTAGDRLDPLGQLDC